METPAILRVEGNASLSIRPDWVSVFITLVRTDENYETLVSRSREELAALQEQLAPLGFAAEDLKTQYFNIGPRYFDQPDEKGVFRRVFAGYELRHELKLAFAADGALLGKLLAVLAFSSLAPEFRLQYSLHEPESVRETLLRSAVQDARQKALVLADAAGVTLGAIREINYGAEGGAPFVAYAAPMARSLKAADAAPLNATPEDMSFSDRVSVVWEIG